MSAPEAAGESTSSRARQEPEAPQRRWVALVSIPRILAAEDERARAMADATAELELHDPPRPSYLLLHPRIVGDFAHQPPAYILAADRSGGLLFRVTQRRSDYPAAEDEIMYLYSTDARTATALPAVPYSELGVEAQPRRSVGLIADQDPRGGHYMIVQLCPRPSASALLGDDNAENLLCFYTAAAEPKWTVKPLHATTAVRRRNLCGEAGVLAHAGRLYWLALGYGIFFADPFAEAPVHLRFLPLPAGCSTLEEVSEINRAYVAQRRRVAPSEGLLRYVEIGGLSADPDVVAPSVRMWTLVEPEGEEPWWRPEYEVPFAEFWAHESDDAGLPHGEVPRLALVDPDDHHVVYFLNVDGSKLIIMDMDERTKRVVSCEDCLVLDDREIMLQNSRPIIDAWEQSSARTPVATGCCGERSRAAALAGAWSCRGGSLYGTCS